MGWIIVFFLGGDHMVFIGNRGGGGGIQSTPKKYKGGLTSN